MKLDKQTVEKIASLAQLEFGDKEKQEILEELNNILEFVEKIDELDTEDVEPLIYITDEENKLRPDEIHQEVEKKDALRNAPLNDSDYFKVPKVLDQERGEES